MIDTHVHLNVEEFNNDYHEVIARAFNSGIKKMIIIGMDYETSRRALFIANQYDNIFVAVGVHPSYVDSNNQELIEALYNEDKVIAVGEIGLDFYWQTDNKDIQEKIFKHQLERSIELNLPVIIHTRNSFDEAFKIVESYKGKIKGVFHCFSSNYEDAKKVIELGMKIGIDGPITFKKNEILTEIIEKIDLDNILIETDSPYMAPVPNRGKRNEPANLAYIAEKIAEIKRVSVEDVINQTTLNANRMFNIEVKK